MSRVDPRRVKSDDKMKYLDILWSSIAELKTRDEVKNFFKDLLTPGESIMLARRISIAKMLIENRTYEDIKSVLGVGLDTISKVHRWLSSGFGGYEKALERFDRVVQERFKKTRREKYSSSLKPYTFDWLKKKYPMHFLLFNLFDKFSK